MKFDKTYKSDIILKINKSTEDKGISDFLVFYI